MQYRYRHLVEAPITKGVPLLFLLGVVVSLRLAWVFYTNFTAEDAFITFQFARNVARGEGFALNPGQPIYGSTTPLLTLLLAGWLLLSKNVVMGARLIGLLACTGGIWFLYHGIQEKHAAFLACFAIALSARMYLEEMGGMEMGLLLLFAAASFYGFQMGRPILAGIMAGLLLWTRVDSLVWVVCLFGAYLLLDRKHAWRFALAVGVLYAPWLLFAWVYFGSVIPYTIIAKQVAYGINSSPVIQHFFTIIRYISVPIFIAFLVAGLVPGRDKVRWLFFAFVMVDAICLAVSGATFFGRYFYMLTFSVYVFIAYAAANALDMLPKNYTPVFYGTAVLLILLASLNSILDSRNFKRLQVGRHTKLQFIGDWLNRNTEPGSSVLLEPMGYVGYYADRVMLDEVGLVTPQVVELHRQGISGSMFFSYLWPDYVIWHCGVRGEAREALEKGYKRVVQRTDRTASLSCYEIWSKIKPDSP